MRGEINKRDLDMDLPTKAQTTVDIRLGRIKTVVINEYNLSSKWNHQPAISKLLLIRTLNVGRPTLWVWAFPPLYTRATFATTTTPVLCFNLETGGRFIFFFQTKCTTWIYFRFFYFVRGKRKNNCYIQDDLMNMIMGISCDFNY